MGALCFVSCHWGNSLRVDGSQAQRLGFVLRVNRVDRHNRRKTFDALMHCGVGVAVDGRTFVLYDMVIVLQVDSHDLG